MKVGLVLGGGGARGFAHIGVMRALEERNIEPVAIAGCSMGGIIGAFVANRIRSDEIQKIFANMRPTSILDWSSKGGLLGGRGIEKQIDRHLPKTIGDLDLPFKVTAVDLQEGRLYIFTEGDLATALRATSAVPGMFSPVQHDGRVLVDGGLLSNTPIEVVRAMTTMPVIAVDVTPPPDRKVIVDDHRNFIDKLKSPVLEGKRPLFFELLTKAYEIPAAILNDVRVASMRPEVLIRPKLDRDLKLEDFHRMEEAVAAGYEQANRVLDRYLEQESDPSPDMSQPE